MESSFWDLAPLEIHLVAVVFLSCHTQADAEGVNLRFNHLSKMEEICEYQKGSN